jgi:WD40 repeat protein
MGEFLLDPIDIEQENLVADDDVFLRNESDDAIDPAILNLLQQWNIGGPDPPPCDDDAEDLLASWDDNGWNPPTPPPSVRPLYDAFFHHEGMVANDDEDPSWEFFHFSTTADPASAATANEHDTFQENDFAAFYFCQPCHDPLATVPWFLPDDDVEVDRDDGLWKDLFDLQQEDDAFWQQQPFMDDDDLEPLPLFSSTDRHSPENEADAMPEEVVNAATLQQAGPYVAAFAPSVFPVAEKSASFPLERAREEYQARICAALDRTPGRFPQPPRECYGHAERILGGALSHDGRYLATASQDATVRVWAVATQRLLHTLPSRKDSECLRVAWTHAAQWGAPADHERYLLATGGADGNVYIWGCVDPEARNSDAWTLHTQLDHSLMRAQKKAASISTTNAITELGTIAEEGAEDHGQDGGVEMDETPQIYSLQFISHWAALSPSPNSLDPRRPLLLTSSDDYVHVWERVVTSKEDEHSPKKQKSDALDDGAEDDAYSVMLFEEVLSLHFTCLDHAGYGVRVGSWTAPPNNFGGARNPHNLVYVFDSAYCAANGILGVALSDGTLRLMNGRGVCLSVLQLPPASEERVSTHLTSFAWDRTGQRLATTVATGHLVTWNLEVRNPLGWVDPPEGAVHPLHRLTPSEGIHATCCAVMDGGHAFGKPLYGCVFLGADDTLLLSYGSDGRICLWDSRRVGEVHAPVAILWDNPYRAPPPARKGGGGEGEGYPIYAMAVTPPTKCAFNETNEDKEGGSVTPTTYLYQSTVVIAGGGTAAGGLLGTPVFLQDVYFLSPEEEHEASTNPSLLSPTTEPAV